MFGQNTDLKDKIERETLRRLYSFNQLFNKLIEIKYFQNLLIDEHLLYIAIKSAYIDLYRVSHFHEIEIVDRHKEAAFFIKWINKTKPIMIIKSEKTHDIKSILSNESFAIMMGFNILNIDISVVTEKYIKNLTYILHYRELEGLILSSMMYLLECGINKIAP